MEILELVIDFLSNNPFVFVALFIVSLLANIIQIYTFYEDKKRLKDEIEEKNKLIKLVETYEYLLNLAQKNIKTEDQLKSVEEEIALKSDIVSELATRAELLEKNAQRKLISQVIDRNISILSETYEEIKELKREYQNLGDLPEIPIHKREEIESQIDLAIRRPYEFPKSFLFKSIILVLFVFLLPGPIDTIIVLAFLGLVLEIFFEAVWLFNDLRLMTWIFKYKSFIVYGSAFLTWRSVISFLISFFIYQPLSISDTLSDAMPVNRATIETIELILVGVFTYFHGRYLMIDQLTVIFERLQGYLAEFSTANVRHVIQSRTNIKSLIDKKHLLIVATLVMVAISITFAYNKMKSIPIAQINQDVLVNDIRWKVTRVEDLGTEALSRYGIDEYIDASSNHKFLSVEIEVENQRLEFYSFDVYDIYVIDDQGRNFSYYREMYQIVSDEQDCRFENINPNAIMECTIIYEVPIDSENLVLEAEVEPIDNRPSIKLVVNLSD